MNLLTKGLAFLISVAARWKGMKFGKNSYIGPGYDWLHVNLKGVVIGNNITIGRNAWIQTTKPKNSRVYVTIGHNSQIGRHVVISAIEKITIGKNCLLAYNVSILDHDHNLQSPLSPIESGLGKAEKVIIEDECFIGAHSFILKGVHLGKHCVVGANSLVTKSFPAFSVIGGNPARLIKRLK